jgi:ligand-binding sensor domain-containing protein
MRRPLFLSTFLFGALLLSAGIVLAADEEVLPRVYTEWETFTVKDGLPHDKVYCLAVDEDRLWVGTENGLGLYEDGRWTVYNVEDGLVYPAILALAVDHESRDLWIATMKGLSRFSAGRFENFTQFNSGLPNDVVFGVCVENQNVWVATTAGTGRYRVRDKRWDVWTPANSPQHEPWGYFVTYNDGKVYAALWGGGVLEFDIKTEGWRSWLDPDGEMEYALFRDAGLIHVITTSASYEQGLLWVSTYFGMSRFDGRRWRGYLDHDSGLVSNFINLVKAKGRVAWVCTDKGLSVVNAENERWVTYTPSDPAWEKERLPPLTGSIMGDDGWEARIYEDDKLIEVVKLKNGLANNHIYGVDFQGDEVWVATSKGLSRGTWRKEARADE